MSRIGGCRPRAWVGAAVARRLGPARRFSPAPSVGRDIDRTLNGDQPDSTIDRDPARQRAAVVDRIRSLLAEGAPWAACDAFRDAIVDAPDDADLLYWGALASARAGARRQTQALLDRAIASDGLSIHLRQEALSLSGRLWKDLVHDAAPSPQRSTSLARACDDYLRAYALEGDPYPAVNAATMSLLLGDRETSRRLAGEVLARFDATRAASTSWEHATRGEALLLVDRVDEACAAYRSATDAAGNDAGTIAAMRRQLALVAEVLPAADRMMHALPAATVLGFVGHVIDGNERATPRFPAALEPDVAGALRAFMAPLHRPIVYASAACGSDLLFIEAALAREAEVNIVLPFDRDEFVRASVAIAGPRWVERFESALSRASRVIHATTESHLGADILFEHAQRLVEGLSALRASQLQTTPSLLCAIDLASEATTGGTRAAYDRWVRVHGPPAIIDLAALRTAAGLDAKAHTSSPVAVPQIDRSAQPPRTIKTMLFADVAGFGRLHDVAAPLFHARFLNLVADCIASCRVPPLEANTWGDALYVVFDAAGDGAALALDLVERARTFDWVDAGLAATTQIRVALHAGPVFCAFDPVIHRDSYFGSSVTHTARIEPVTQPGLVYASEAFAATLMSEGETRYAFEYVGNLALPKRYGMSRLYRVERR